MRPRIALVLLPLLAGCLDSPTAPREVSLGQEFELAPGQAASLDGGLTVRLEQVLSDSRCPADALCVWAGDAVVRVVVTRSGRPSSTAELHTAAGFDRTTSYDGLEVSLVKVLPYPVSSGTIAAKDYRATLLVSRPMS
jgi:hypothetical protein